MERGTRKTTRQMLAAQNGAVFIWCNQHIDYAQHLARHLGRPDLEIVRPSWLDSYCWQGRRVSEVVLDHAACLTIRQGAILREIQDRIAAHNA